MAVHLGLHASKMRTRPCPCGGRKLAQWPLVLQTICLPDLGFCPGAPAGEEPEDFQGMKQESWLHAHMRCKAGHLSGSLRGGEERVSVIRSRLLSLEIARAARRRPATLCQKNRVRLVSYLGPRGELEAHLEGALNTLLFTCYRRISPILSIKNNLFALY